MPNAAGVFDARFADQAVSVEEPELRSGFGDKGCGALPLGDRTAHAPPPEVRTAG